jgi:surface polysaccharide O-acyltransferase-like enzyme
MKEKERLANVEALRILAMFMVVALHYLGKGNVAVSLVEDGSGVNLAAWLIEAFCIVAVNVYVLISGYFLVEGSFHPTRLFRLIAQIWVYSLGVPLVCLILHIGNVADWDRYDWLRVLLPLENEHYWFATAYVIFYLLSPLLAAGVKKLTKRQLETVIVLLVLLFSVGKSIIPVELSTDNYGYDFGWFICLFLIAAYLRLYGKALQGKKKLSFLIYVLLVFVLWGLSIVFGILSRKGWPLSYALDMLYSYNHILVLMASVALFVGFLQIEIKNQALASAACRLAPYTFGVYLLHENAAVRLLWQGWLGVERVRGSLAFIPHLLFSVCAVFLAGVAVDFVRACLFKTIERAGKRILQRNLQK